MSVDRVDAVDLVAIVATVKVDTEDVMLAKAKRVGHLVNLLLRSVVGLAEVVVRHLRRC